METGRRGNNRGGRRGNDGRGLYRGKGGRGNRQDNFEGPEKTHGPNFAGGNPFLHPNQHDEEARRSNSPRHRGLSFNRELEDPFARDYRTEYQHVNPNVSIPSHQGRGAFGQDRIHNPPRAQYPPYPPYTPFSPPPHFNQEPLNFPGHQKNDALHSTSGRQFQHNVQHFMQNPPPNVLESPLMQNQNQRFQRTPNHLNRQETHLRREDNFISNNRGSQFQTNYAKKNYPRSGPEMPNFPEQQHEQGPRETGFRFQRPMDTAWKSETNLSRRGSVESLNSVKSLHLNPKGQNLNKANQNRKSRKKNNQQNNYSSNLPDMDLSSSGENRPLSRSSTYSNEPRPLSRSSTYSNDPFKDLEGTNLELGVNVDVNVNKPTHQFRGRGKNRGYNNRGTGGKGWVRSHESFTGTDLNHDQKPVNRSSFSNDLSNNYENIRSSPISDSGVKNFSNRNKNFRGRGKGFGGYTEAVRKEGSESGQHSRRSSCSNDDGSPQDIDFDTSFNLVENENKQKVYEKNLNRKHKKQQKNQLKEKNKNENQKRLEKNQQSTGTKSSLSLEQLEKLKQYDPMEILQILSENNNEYSSMLQDDFEPNMFVIIVEILSKICETPSGQLRAELLRQAGLPAFTSQLFTCVTKYPYLEDDDMLQYVNQFFENTILLYETLSDFMPSAVRMWYNHIIEVQKSLQKMSKNPKIALNHNLLNTAKYLLDEIGQSLKQEVKEEKVENEKKEKETYFPEPVGNFRTVSLYPRPEDIYAEQPFLFPNITKGPYRSIEHYLDIHFKLLREDFMSPIRQAMRDYKKQCNTKDRFKRVNNVRIYRKVKFLHPKTVMDTVGYEVCFDVDKKITRVNWEFSNRFMFGSLLLFTNDNFESFFLATVANRNVKELENKLVTVELVEQLGNVKSLLGKEFIMAESEAYFNPYFHVLKALQRFDETNFPLANYIVHANTETQPPIYLNFAEIYSIKMAGQSFTFRVLSDLEWPTHEQLGLDHSQYEAFRAALTNDLTVIQGPPGTGKTFLGLKIAHALLNNFHVWNQGNTPIFVVCFTNHALDQFLEGLLPVTTKLVRIGGKSKGSELDKFNIRERRKEYSYYKKVQGREIRDLKLKMSTVFADIQVYQTNLKALENRIGVISIKTLRLVMSEHQWNYFSGEDDFLDWLLVGVAGAKNKEQVRITITADRGVVRETAPIDPVAADAEDFRIKQAFFDTIDLDTSVGPSEDTVTIQYACDLESISKKKEEFVRLLNGNKNRHKNQLIELKGTCERLDMLLHYLRKELLESKKYPHSDLEKENLLHEGHLRKLKPNDRWKLYNTWVNILRDGLIVTLGEKDAQYKEYSFKYEQLRQNDDLQILKSANVVGTTTTLAAKFQPMFEALAPRIVIVEEAAEVLEAHIIASLSRSCQHLILIGDHKQLRPSVAETRMARQYQLDVSLFERLVLNNMACHTLTLQHRMRPEISRQLVPTIYRELRDDQSVLNRENIKGMDKNCFFMTHDYFEDEVLEITSKRNRFEADILLGLARYLVQQGYKPKDITILATYKGQMYHMKNEIRNKSEFPKGIQITVVDNFQGEENKIILLSLVRSNALNKIGFLEIENRICVALSRARDGLYIVGNMKCLAGVSEIWAKIRNSLAKNKEYGPALKLRCQIHPEQITLIESAKDFSKVTEGGCSLLCGQPLPCGHLCKSMCHVEQDYHQKYKCKEPCSKILCREGHQCPKKCHQACGQCQILMRRQLPCEHFANVPCSMDLREHRCTETVQVEVPFCRHTVNVPCHTRFHPECNLPCTKRLECGHSCELQCHEMDDPDHLEYACMKPCARLNKDCSLDHKCEMACFEECKPCPEKVLRELPCGHSLKLLCSIDLNTIVCQQKCDKTLNCNHKCTKKCYQQCEPCLVPMKKTVMRCKHEIEVPCGTIASRQMCTGRCPNLLDCGHQCSKRCMDNCSRMDCVQPVQVKEKVSLISRLYSRNKLFPMLCGHEEVHVPCNIVSQVDTMKPEQLMQYCSEPCMTELSCNHVCSGTCSQCMQGRIHKLCKEPCGNVLICGHSCQVYCREVCPPCNQPCRHECKHSKCNRKCGEECVPCKEPCDYACEHLQCSRRCGELCDREPCYEPCSKKLSCGHSCVGFCGEPCPPCRSCEQEHFEEIFYTGEETEDDAKWVKLVDCGHTVESSGMEMWLNMEQENGEIGCKVCPRCKTPIVKVQRFMNIIKQTYLDIQTVKGQCFGKRDEIRRERAIALRKIQNVVFSQMTSDNEVDELEKLYNELIVELPEVKSKKRNTIDTQKLRVLCFWTEFFISLYTRKQDVWSRLDEESKKVLNEKINSLTRPLMKRRQKVSEEEMKSFESEVRRIHRIADLYVYTSSADYRMASSYSGAKGTREAIECLLLSFIGYSEELDDKVKHLLAVLKYQIKSSTVITDEERSMINKAMSSSFNSSQRTGHWFKCKNGHIYCITECGGAMQQAKCPVAGCGETIGGQQHRLRDDQAIASEMDGARHAAWSEANNMANFGWFQ